mmetsp:Transcript_12588/g.27148  ORF Transcript_12588/g.27148 Transcript_12588/m.27148 type:complete len:494 (+) Transcript_12588:2-1483(+)
MNRHQNHYPPNNNDDNIVPPFLEPILQYYNSLPPLTRTWFTLSLLTTALHTLDIFETRQLTLQWDTILPPQLELWRLLTSFVWAGPGTLVDFPVLMLLYSMVVVVPDYERDPHETCLIEDDDADEARGPPYHNHEEDVPTNSDELRDRIANRWMPRPRTRPVHRLSDCTFAFLVCAVLVLLTHFLVTETSAPIGLLRLWLPSGSMQHLNGPLLMPVFTRTLLYSIITLHSLKHPDQQQNINFFPVPGRYVPLFHVMFGLLMGYRINETIHGILVGLTYAVLVEEGGRLASLLRRKRVLNAPRWLIHLVGEEGNVAIIDRTSGEANNNANDGPYREIALEPGANHLHHAATIGDVALTRSHINRAVTSADVARATAPFRQQDRNGWQPLHEAARAGQLQVLKILLEVVDDGDDAAGPDVASGGDDGGSGTRLRRRGTLERKLNVDVNARTNNDRGYTALRLAEENHGEDSQCAMLLREAGGLSFGFGDDAGGEE